MTAVDLVAATIGRLHLDPVGADKEYDLGSLPVARLDCVGCREWAIAVKGSDADYSKIIALRHSMVHRRPSRNLYVGTDARVDITPDRTAFPFGASTLAAPAIIDHCRAFALKHVVAFIDLVSKGEAVILTESSIDD